MLVFLIMILYLLLFLRTGGNPFAKLDVLPISTRRRWSDEDSINLLKVHTKKKGHFFSLYT